MYDERDSLTRFSMAGNNFNEKVLIMYIYLLHVNLFLNLYLLVVF